MIIKYEYNGVEAFIQPYTNYTLAIKMDVLNFMMEKGTSLNETAAVFKIPAPSTISVWKNNTWYRCSSVKEKGASNDNCNDIIDQFQKDFPNITISRGQILDE
ncbi:hypothetical protein FC756_24105 [Lysinibacillus mangiferihumi]|uniref:Transposase Synechocystis PCC 6803 domain-containing protein n=1 Tax=Lysinibacillus mangiferihumi TaxID=1130819 RepID=A0A4U2XZK2_9BACI|nr:hypothetical protein [Lysinibacillus mangiferihumi]TKI53427.1 hypothetical protein FC756_24105 [Lysinibacillus mangiferihumi]